MENGELFAHFSSILGISIKFAMFSKKKKKPHQSSISEVIDSERCAYLIA